MESTKETKAFFTPKKIMRILSLSCIVFAFCPVFLVSCSSQVVEVDVMTAVGGMSMYGETVVEPHPIMLLCLLIPIATSIMLFVKKITPRKVAINTMVIMLINFIMWLIFKSAVKEIAEQNYCKVEVTGWFYLNIVSIILIIILAFLIVIKALQMDTDLVRMASGSGTQEAINQLSARVNQVTNLVIKLTPSTENNVKKRIGFCLKCGNELMYGSRFCASCGSPIPKNVLVEVEEKKKEELTKKEADEKQKSEYVEEEKELFCQQCGFKVETGARFCKQCGAKIE